MTEIDKQSRNRKSKRSHNDVDIRSFYATFANQKLGVPTLIDPENARWMQKLIEAYSYMNGHQLRRMSTVSFFVSLSFFLDCDTRDVESLEEFSSLLHVFPGNIHCLVSLGRIQADLEMNIEAHTTFSRVRHLPSMLL